MRPTLRQLEYLVAVADFGRIGLAADHLNVSQPSLSSQIAEIETELGVRLFVRGRNGARITPAGEEVVRRARRLMRDHQDLCAAAQGGGLFQGRLRLGVLPSIGPYLLPGVVRRLHKEHPSLRLVVREENTRSLDDGLRNGRLDVIISTPEDHAGLPHAHLFREGLWAAMPEDHHLASTAGQLPLAELHDEVLLTLGSGHRLSQIVVGLAEKAQARVSDEYEGTSMDAVRLMAASGAGIAILPSIYAATEARRGTDIALRRLSDPQAARDIALVRSHAWAEESAVLVDILISEAKRILAGR